MAENPETCPSDALPVPVGCPEPPLSTPLNPWSLEGGGKRFDERGEVLN